MKPEQQLEYLKKGCEEIIKEEDLLEKLKKGKTASSESRV